MLCLRPFLLLAAACAALLVAPALATAAPGGVTYLAGADRCIAASGGAFAYHGSCNSSVFPSATDVALAPSGLTAYVAAGDKLAILDRDPATGALTQKPGPEGCWDTVAVADEPDGITCVSHEHEARRGYFSPQQVEVHGDLVLVASSFYVDVFRRSQDGTLTPLACGSMPNAFMGCAAVLPSWNAARELAASPDGQRLYVASGAAVVGYAVDPLTGAITEPSSGACVTAGDATATCDAFRGLDAGNGVSEITLSADGGHLYAGGVYGLAAFAVDQASGSLTQLTGAAGCVGADTPAEDGCAVRANAYSIHDIDVSPDGKDLYAASRDSGLLAFDRAADGGLAPAGCFGQTTASGCTALATYQYKPYELAVSPAGDTVYTFGSSTSLQAFARDETTGALTPLAGSEGCVFHDGANGCQASGPFAQPEAIFLDPLGKHLYFGGDSVIVAMRREQKPGAPVDQAGPQVLIDRPVAGQRFLQGDDARASFRCTDDIAVATCSGTIADGARLDTATLGEKSITVTATDLAGHKTTTKVGYFVDARPAQWSPPADPPRTLTPPPPAPAPKPTAPAPKPKPSPQLVQATQKATDKAPSTFSGSGLSSGSGVNLGTLQAQTQAKVQFAGVIAPGGANVIAAGGGNVVAAGGGNVVAAGGLNHRAVIASAAAATKPAIVTVAQGNRFFPRAGKGKVRVKLTPAGRRLLKKAFRRRGRQTVELTLAITLSTRGSAAPGVMATKTVKIRE